MAGRAEAGIGVEHPGKQAGARALARTSDGSEQFLEVTEVPRPAGGTLVVNDGVTADERDIDGPVPTTAHAATGVFEGDAVDPVEQIDPRRLDSDGDPLPGLCGLSAVETTLDSRSEKLSRLER